MVDRAVPADALVATVRVGGLRRSRSNGVAETGLRRVLTAAAIGLGRIADRIAEREPARTRASASVRLVTATTGAHPFAGQVGAGAVPIPPARSHLRDPGAALAFGADLFGQGHVGRSQESVVRSRVSTAADLFVVDGTPRSDIVVLADPMRDGPMVMEGGHVHRRRDGRRGSTVARRLVGIMHASGDRSTKDAAVNTFIATLGTETNTFSPIPTGWAAFRECMVHRGTGSTEGTYYFAHPMRVWREEAERRRYAVVESLSAFAQPAGPTSRIVGAELRDTVLDDLAAAGPVDLALLHLHGAMVAEGCDDCEGDLLRRVRERVGPRAVIGVELDLHCHLTDAMVSASTVVVLYKEYPHVDVADRALDLFALCDDALHGRTAPVMALHDCRMLGVWRTTTQPSRGLIDRMAAREGHGGILSMSFCHGFPWADVPDVGAKVLAVADGDAAVAERAAAEVARDIWDLRDEAEVPKLSVAAAVAVALAPPPGLTVLADVSDNAGAGAASDSTVLLSALLEAGARDVLLGCLWDPAAVRLCAEAGEGAALKLRLGGKTGPGLGTPLDVAARVLRTLRGAGQTFAGGRQPMGDAVLLAVGGMHVAVNAVRTQTFHPDAFEQFGVALRDYAAVVVKSAQHFAAGFGPACDRILYVAAPGTASPDFAALRLPKAGRPLWPQVADPFAPQPNP